MEAFREVNLRLILLDPREVHYIVLISYKVVLDEVVGESGS